MSLSLFPATVFCAHVASGNGQLHLPQATRVEMSANQQTPFLWRVCRLTLHRGWVRGKSCVIERQERHQLRLEAKSEDGQQLHWREGARVRGHTLKPCAAWVVVFFFGRVHRGVGQAEGSLKGNQSAGPHLPAMCWEAKGDNEQQLRKGKATPSSRWETEVQGHTLR